MRLMAGEHVVAVAPEFAQGPGWSNRPLTIIVSDSDGKLRSECLQPDEQGTEIGLLFATCASAHSAMREAVERRIAGGGGGRKRTRPG